MKTKILISSIAALCLLITFAEAPRRHGENKINPTSTDNISIEISNRATMLPGVVITNHLNNKSLNTVPAIPAEDFSYLKFDVTAYMEADAINPDDAEILPEAADADYTYLKFKISDFATELNSYELTEMPVNEDNTTLFSLPEPVANEFERFRFNVNDYYTGSETTEIGELPAEESKTANQDTITVDVTANEFDYLKFDVTKYYSSANASSGEEFELPEE